MELVVFMFLSRLRIRDVDVQIAGVSIRGIDLDRVSTCCRQSLRCQVERCGARAFHSEGGAVRLFESYGDAAQRAACNTHSDLLAGSSLEDYVRVLSRYRGCNVDGRAANK